MAQAPAIHVAWKRFLRKQRAAAMIAAARQLDLSAVERILDRGGDPFENIWRRGVGFECPVAVAIRTGHVPLVKLMVRDGWKPMNATGRIGDAADGPEDIRASALQAALDIAVAANLIPMARFLVDEGAAVQANLFHVPIVNGNTEMVGALCARLADGHFHKGSEYLLHEAAKRGHVGTIRELVRVGMHLDAEVDRWHITHIAAANDRVDVLRYLHESGALRDAARDGWTTPLALAAAANCVAAARFLLDHGARVDGMGRVPLIEAIERGHNAMARLLLDYGADVNRGCHTTSSALALAIRRQNEDAVRLLVAFGADLAATFNGYEGPEDYRITMNAADYAESRQAFRIARILRDAR